MRVGAIKFFRPDKGFGFIIDKETRKDVWFHQSKIKTSEDASVAFRVGEEVCFEISIKLSGKKPGEPHAINISTIHGDPFCKLHVPLMC